MPYFQPFVLGPKMVMKGISSPEVLSVLAVGVLGAFFAGF